MTTIRFEVLGVPAPQGDKSAVMINGAPRVIEGRRGSGRAKHRNWRSAVAEAARDLAAKTGKLDGPLRVDIVYRFPMPASRPAALRKHGQGWKISAPDRDKLDRATNDGLTAGGLIADDARICAGGSTKLEVVEWTGAVITITKLGATP